ncbi:MAG: hypothetical protein C7B46_00625 [Sulfobacillus benefaciens]|uniref:Uncharacterized protein n=1 Tax=Sulfobacillus benefaciens TaxID=453960 RepID=A0A2T2XM31_9FIRM|nr:MAG: hypothetical protein C7B46_00625 [Sulfobacillus benefaciens]
MALPLAWGMECHGKVVFLAICNLGLDGLLPHCEMIRPVLCKIWLKGTSESFAVLCKTWWDQPSKVKVWGLHAHTGW